MDTTMPRDYYEILGVPRNASKDELKKAFRQLARQYHPDVSSESDAEERFKEINEAYTVLNDDQKRAAYDRFGHAGVNATAVFPAAVSAADFPASTRFSRRSSAGWVASAVARRQRGPVQGRDLRYDMTIDFEQAVFGAEVDIEVNRREKLPDLQRHRRRTGHHAAYLPGL